MTTDRLRRLALLGDTDAQRELDTRLRRQDDGVRVLREIAEAAKGANAIAYIFAACWLTGAEEPHGSWFWFSQQLDSRIAARLRREEFNRNLREVLRDHEGLCVGDVLAIPDGEGIRDVIVQSIEDGRITLGMSIGSTQCQPARVRFH